MDKVTKEIKKHAEKEKKESTKHKTIKIDDVPKGYGEFDFMFEFILNFSTRNKYNSTFVLERFCIN